MALRPLTSIFPDPLQKLSANALAFTLVSLMMNDWIGGAPRLLLRCTAALIHGGALETGVTILLGDRVGVPGGGFLDSTQPLLSPRLPEISGSQGSAPSCFNGRTLHPHHRTVETPIASRQRMDASPGACGGQQGVLSHSPADTGRTLLSLCQSRTSCGSP